MVTAFFAKRTGMLLALFATPALVGSQTKADYAATTAILDAGGQRTSAASYTNDGSIGAVGGVSAPGAYTARGGFPGQLYDMSNALVVVLAQGNVAEGTSMQLAVQGVADDTTLLNLAPESVNWSSIGPVSITAHGSVMGGAVYRNTAATVVATRDGASGQRGFVVLDTLPDNFGLYAGDGLDDDWQIHFFGLENLNGTATADPDSDGQDNRLEFFAQTMPEDSLSRLRLRIEKMTGQSTTLLFSPHSLERNYMLEWSADFVEWFPLDPFSEGAIATEYYFIDENAQELRRFYRLVISR